MMHNLWCWSPGRSPRSAVANGLVAEACLVAPAALAWVPGLALFALSMLFAVPASAVTVMLRSIDVEVQPPDALLETTHLVVRLDDADDVAAWSTYRLFDDTNRQLERLEVRITAPDGAVRTVGQEAIEAVSPAGGVALHRSERSLLLHLAPLEPGSTLEIHQRVSFSPYFPASRVNLRGTGGVETLEVRVHGASAGWRWRIDGASEGLAVRAFAGGVEVHGQALAPRIVPPLSPDETRRTVLRFAWGAATDWPGVARWYRDRLAGLPPVPEAVRDTARSLVAGASDARVRLDRLSRFLAEKVRYVVVSIAEGNVEPSPAGETLERRWGDCKDKALLLIEMLHATGIEAFPALIRLDADGRIDEQFPSPIDFNHAIVAVPVSEVSVTGDDPVAGGYLFVDTTQRRAAGHWLAPELQGQRALVVEPEGGTLVTTPLAVHAERRRIDADLVVDARGDARGSLRLRLSGGAAYTALAWLDTLAPADAVAEARALLASFLPGAGLEAVTIAPVVSEIPAVVVEARLRLPGWVRGLSGPRPSLRLPGMRAAPDPSLLAGRTVPLAVPLAEVEAHWRLTLANDRRCRLRARDVAVERAVGAFVQQMVTREDRSFEIDRSTTLRQRFIEVGDLADLEAVALAEHQSHRRRIRLECSAGAPRTAATPR